MSGASGNNSGDGIRPTTDGGVDNIGAAGSFTPGQKGGSNSPAPPEKMSSLRKKDRASIKADDSAAFNLKPSADSTPNKQPLDHPPGSK